MLSQTYLDNCVVYFNNEKCRLAFGHYDNTQNISIFLMTEEDEVYLKATTIVPDLQLSSSEVMIKDYSENFGVDVALQNAGVIGKRLRYGPHPVFELLKKPPGF